jgi:hypothetical protein
MDQKKYILVEKMGSNALTISVNKLLDEGYVLYGPPGGLQEPHGNLICWQALVLPSEKEKSQG